MLLVLLLIMLLMAADHADDGGGGGGDGAALSSEGTKPILQKRLKNHLRKLFPPCGANTEAAAAAAATDTTRYHPGSRSLEISLCCPRDAG
jgi:hypothetical protein